MAPDGLAQRQESDHRLPRILIVERVAGLEQGLEQFGEPSMPVGKRLGRFADQDHLEDARHNRHESIAAVVGLAAGGDRAALGVQPVEGRLDLFNGPMLGSGQLPGRKAPDRMKVAHQSGFFLGERVLDQRDQLVTDRRAQQQRARELLGHVAMRGR